MRVTQITPDHITTTRLQSQLEAMWNLIENYYEEDWRVEANGDMTLEVDEALLERIMADTPAIALGTFECYEEHNPEYEKWEWINLPEQLLGTYTIKGVYDASQRFVNGTREYFFVQEGY